MRFSTPRKDSYGELYLVPREINIGVLHSSPISYPVTNHYKLGVLYLMGCGRVLGMELAQKKCVSCEGGMPPATRDEATILLKQINGWTLSGDSRWISKEFKFKDFAEALAFTDKVGAIAEEEGHHPDIQLSWGKVVVELTTHAIKGLSENDFILAAKIDKIA